MWAKVRDRKGYNGTEMKKSCPKTGFHILYGFFNDELIHVHLPELFGE